MSGKGSQRRPLSISREEWDDNWKQIFEPQDDMLTLMNRARELHKKTPYRYNEKLDNAARKHTEWQVKHKTCSHFEGFDGFGVSPEVRVAAVGYKGMCSENVAWSGSDSVTDKNIFDMWKFSAGHMANILGDYVDLGYCLIDGYATAVFGREEI